MKSAIRPTALALLALCGAVLADPSPEIQYLTHEPASMLDVGLDRLRDSIEGLLRFNQHDLSLKTLPSVHTTYDFERNQIVVLVTASEHELPAPKQTCAALVRGVQTWMNASTAWENGFTHSGYTHNDQKDAAVMAKLPPLVRIQGVAISETALYSGDATRAVMGTADCSATLTSPVTFTEPPRATK